MSTVEDTLKEMNERLARIEERLGIMHTDCSKMSQHIDFVEKVWTKLRSPLGYFIGKQMPKEIKG